MALNDVFKHALPMKLKDGKRHVFPTVADLVYRANNQPLEDENGVLIADDSNRLGGKSPSYYLPAVNLLDNSNFRRPIGQAGLGDGVYHGSDLYPADRWKEWASTVETHQFDPITGLTTSGKCTLAQVVNVQLNKPYTIALGFSDGTVLAANGVLSVESSIGLGDPKGTVRLYVAGGITYYAISFCTNCIWAALYEGEYTAETLPPYVPKGYAAELLECKRYYRRFKQAYIPAALHITSIKRYVISFMLDVPFIKTGTNPSVNIIKAPGTLRAGGKTYDLADVMVYEVKEYDGSLYIIFQTSTAIPDAYAAFVGESEYEISKDL